MVKHRKLKRASQIKSAPTRRTLGVSLHLADYEDFARLAAADKRKPGALAAIVLLDFLKQHRVAPDTPAAEGKSS